MKKSLNIPDDARLALEVIVHLLRSHTAPTMSTGEAGRVLGCKKDKVLDLVQHGLLNGYKLPSAKSPHRVLPAVNEKLSDAEASNDPRHHRIPTISVLMTVIREWINGAHGIALSPGSEECIRILGPLVAKLDLTTKRQLHQLLGNYIATHEDQLAMLTKGLPAKGPRSPRAMHDSPPLPLS